MGHVGINRTHPDRFRLEILNRILGGGGLFSRLATEVRVKRGLTYGIYSYFAEREFTGEFAVGTFTKLDTVGEAVEVIVSELEKIRNEPPSEQELREARQGLIGSYPLRFEEYEGIAETLVHQNFYNLPMTDITEYGRYIQAVTGEDVMEAARKHIHPEDMVITILGPVDAIKPQVERFGEVEIVEAI